MSTCTRSPTVQGAPGTGGEDEQEEAAAGEGTDAEEVHVMSCPRGSCDRRSRGLSKETHSSAKLP